MKEKLSSVPRKVALIDLSNYPKDQYFAYWEIRVLDITPEEGFMWGVRIYSRDTGELLDEVVDVAATRDEADTLAQTYVLNSMNKFKRGA